MKSYHGVAFCHNSHSIALIMTFTLTLCSSVDSLHGRRIWYRKIHLLMMSNEFSCLFMSVQVCGFVYLFECVSWWLGADIHSHSFCQRCRCIPICCAFSRFFFSNRYWHSTLFLSYNRSIHMCLCMRIGVCLEISYGHFYLTTETLGISKCQLTGNLLQRTNIPQ